MKRFTAYALEAFPLVKSGDDVADIIVKTSEKNGLQFEDGDIIVVAQKVFSKAEGRILKLREVMPSKRAEKLSKITGKDSRFVELVLKESKMVLKASHEILLVEDKRGLICMNAGIDKSNVEGSENFALLPEFPDRSARDCKLKIKSLTDKEVAVVVCDTYSRPFRRGQVNFAIGVSGLSLFRDYRGKKDLFGQVLKVKNVAIVDEIAAAAELLMGQGAEATPVVMIRGLKNSVKCEDYKVDELRVSEDEDLFRGAL